MKIHAKLITSFGTVLVATLTIFGFISYYTFANSTRQNSDRIITLQSSEVIYQLTKSLNKEIGQIEQELTAFVQQNACSLSSEAETKALFAGFARRNPLFHSISLYHVEARNIPAEFRSWLDEVAQHDQVEPLFRRQSDELYLLWPTQTPTGRAFLVIAIDQGQLAASIRSYLRINGCAVLLSEQGRNLLTPVQQNPLHPMAAEVLGHLTSNLSPGQIERQGGVYTYQTRDTLLGADLTLVVPAGFYQADLNSLKNRIVAAMLIVGWVSVWILLFVAFKISSPIRKLSKATKDIVAFNYSTELEIEPSQDEIGELAESFEVMRQKIKNLVTKDPLTHVYNRLFMMHLFELAVLKAVRQEGSLSCIMMDIDHFKKVNDTYGHQGGDAVLVAVGKTLRENSRDYDTPARYGGEEFIFILPETPLSHAVSIAERIRMAIKGMVIPFEDTEIHCTMSLGVAEFDLYQVNTTDQIIKNADQALYNAKQGGRDQVVAFRKAEG